MKTVQRVSIIGAGQCSEQTYALAKKTGKLLAEHGYELVSGGLKGVMEAASEGAVEAQGKTIGILPGFSRDEANASVQTSLATGLGHMRNFLVILNGDVIVAIEGGYGTLSELALAKKIGKPVIALGQWSVIPGIIPASSPEEIITLIAEHLG